MRKTFRPSLLIAVCCLAALLSCDTGRDRIFKKSRILMDTLVTITVVSESNEKAEKAIDRAFSEIEQIEKLSSFFCPGSDVSRINNAAGISPATVSPQIIDVLNKAEYVSKTTGGAFDATIGPLISLYDFRRRIRPEEDAIRTNLSLVNYRDLIINGEKAEVFLKRKAMRLDLGGIAKGYAADRAAEVLKRDGIRSGLVAVAGDIRTFGRKPDGSPWKIGIRHPRAKDGEDDVMATIELSDMAVSTSGDYERFFLSEGIRYHHLLSPVTGHPARGCRSVSVIAGESALADAFATGVFVLGPEEGMKVLERAGLDGVIVDSLGNNRTTPGIRGKIEVKKAS